MRRSVAGLPILLLATAASLGAQVRSGAAAPAADSVTLHFAWPVGTEAHIEYHQVTDREGDRDQPSHLEIEGELTMHVHEHPQGLLVEHLDPIVTRFRASPPFAPDDPHGAVFGRLGTPTPHYVVSREGKLVTVDGEPQLAAAISAILGPAATQSGTLEGLAQELLNQPLLMGTARERWNAAVGMWLDLTLQEGETAGAESQEANPLVPSVVLPYLYEFQLVGMEPCDAAKPAGAKCARLQMISLPDPKEFTSAMNRALQQVGFMTMSFDGLAQHSEVELLTDPATLLPRELMLNKTVEGILKEGDKSRVFKRLDQLHLVYTYPGG